MPLEAGRERLHFPGLWEEVIQAALHGLCIAPRPRAAEAGARPHCGRVRGGVRERLNSLKAGGASLRFAFMPRSIGARCGPDRSFDSKDKNRSLSL